MTDDRAQWLVIAYKFSSCKRTYFDYNRYVGSSPSSQLKIQILVQVTNRRFEYQFKLRVIVEN